MALGMRIAPLGRLLDARVDAPPPGFQLPIMRWLDRLAEPRHEEPRSGLRRQLKQRLGGLIPGVQREIERAPVHGQQRAAA